MPKNLPHRSIGCMYEDVYHIFVCVIVGGNLLTPPWKIGWEQCGSAMQR